MPNSDKILMKKIKKREKNKLKLLAKKNNNYIESSSDTDDNKSNESKKRGLSAEDHEHSILPKIHGKKKKKSEVEENAKSMDDYNSNEIQSKNNIHGENEVQGDEDMGESELKPKIEKDVEKLELKIDPSLYPEILADPRFSKLKNVLSKQTYKAIKEMGFTTMTDIQAKAIPPLLNGYYLVAASKTGSGKTLAFLIPAVEYVHTVKYKPRNGTGCIILTPTRELAMQTFGVLNELMKYHRQTYGLIMGGANKQNEARKLANGLNIIVATPGRLLDHIKNTPNFVYKNPMVLIIDEADRMMEMGFEQEIKEIMRSLPSQHRQNVLFSATLTKNTEELAAFASPVKPPLYIRMDNYKEQPTVATLTQGFAICPPEKKMLFLNRFLVKEVCRDKKKVMVFFSTCSSVKYHYHLFNYANVPVLSIHGKQEQSMRTTTFFQFCNAESGALFCTDVAARGLDIPAVDCILQYDPPDNPKDYIHRVGRTARGLGTSGKALMLLRPEEQGFLQYLWQAKLRLVKYDIKWDIIDDIQPHFEELISENSFLRQCAKEAFQSYLRAYDSHQLKTIFNVDTLDLAKLAKAFGFAFPPAINFRVPNKDPAKKRKKGGGSYLKEMNIQREQKKKVDKWKK